MNKVQVIILFIIAMIFESFCQSIQQQIQELIPDDDDENVLIENIRISKLKNETLKFECRLSNNNEATFTWNQTYMTFNSKYMTLKMTIKDDISEPIFELNILNLNPNRDAGIYRCNNRVWIITFDPTLTLPKEEIIEKKKWKINLLIFEIDFLFLKSINWFWTVLMSFVIIIGLLSTAIVMAVSKTWEKVRLNYAIIKFFKDGGDIEVLISLANRRSAISSKYIKKEK